MTVPQTSHTVTARGPFTLRRLHKSSRQGRPWSGRVGCPTSGGRGRVRTPAQRPSGTTYRPIVSGLGRRMDFGTVEKGTEPPRTVTVLQRRRTSSRTHGRVAVRPSHHPGLVLMSWRRSYRKRRVTHCHPSGSPNVTSRPTDRASSTN